MLSSPARGSICGCPDALQGEQARISHKVAVWIDGKKNKNMQDTDLIWVPRLLNKCVKTSTRAEHEQRERETKETHSP